MIGDAAEIERMLSARAADLCRELLPAGRRAGQEWIVGSIGGERGESMAIHLTGAKAGVWSDFAAGIGGRSIGLVAAVWFAGDWRAALDWSRTWLGVERTAGPARHRARPVARSDRGRAASEAEPLAEDSEAERRRRAALRLFLEAAPDLRGTPVEDYLSGRGIQLAELGRIPRAIRFNPRVWCGEARRFLPAMVAAISNSGGTHVATHRTFLARDQAGRWVKAPIERQKMVLGSFAGGAIRLWRGASRKPLAAAPPDDLVVLCEGIETALSVVVACPDRRVLAAVSLGNLGRVVLPRQLRSITIAADNDASPVARAALDRACQRLLREGRLVRLAMPPRVGSDFNDLLREDGR